MPAQQGLGDRAGGLAGHAGGHGAGLAVPAHALPQPARPEPNAKVLPGILHGAVGEGPHQLLQPPPLPSPSLQAHLPTVRPREGPQVLEEVRPGPVGPPALHVVHETVVGVVGFLDGQEVPVKLLAQAPQQRSLVDILRAGVKGVVRVLQQVFDGKLV